MTPNSCPAVYLTRTKTAYYSIANCPRNISTSVVLFIQIPPIHK